jgi:anaerobic magnesium-protoporphyrin IX monomethyl ester cyclase
MKICLIEPPKFVSLTNPVSTAVMPPIGLAYIAGTLEHAGHIVSVVDAVGSAPESFFPFGRMRGRGLTPPDIVARVPDDVQLIGISTMFSSYWPMVRNIIVGLRERFPDRTIVLGGEHGTGLPTLCLEEAPLDVVVMGEGEETALELAEVVASGRPVHDIAGIAFRRRTADGVAIVVNPRRKRMRGIDDIPLPAWHLFDIEAYIRTNQPHGASRGRFMPMLATRGCPFQCTFCTSPQMWTQLWVARDPKLVVDEIQMYMRTYGAVDFQFEDLTAVVRKDWIVAFCDELIARGLRITFQLPSGTRSEAIDAECARKMKAAGCHEFAFAPESGDPRVLKAIKKQVNLARMFDSARAAIASGINVGCFFIIGLPQDDYRSIFKTYGVAAKCAWFGFSNVNFSPFSPQPSTEEFKKLSQQGVICVNDDYLMSLFDFQDITALKKSFNPRFSDWQITLMVIIGFAVFYFVYFLRRPQRITQLIMDVVTGSGRNKTSKVVRSVLQDAFRIIRRRSRRRQPSAGSL